MVLFNDTLPPKPKTFFGKCVTWAIRIILFFIALFLLFVGSLNLLQGNSDTQKSGIERTISYLSQKNTNIGELHIFELFPEFHLKFSALKNGMFDDRQINIQDFDFRAPGVLIVKKNGVFRSIDVRHLDFLKNNQVMRSITSIKIIDEEKNAPYLSFQFSQPYKAELQVGLNLIGRSPYGDGQYTVKSSFPFTLYIGESSFSGHVFNESDHMYITGVGKNTDSSLSPFTHNTQENVECFVAEYKISDYKIQIENGIFRTPSGSQNLPITPFEFDFFSDVLNKLDTQEDKPSSPLNINAIMKSSCAS
ncbi:MAG: hypothetical protein JKY11_03415 [Alphaproteobacteria bacterium]|nr:hypothetical protein [Alphaproteobacteria bacterium]